ncbi:hypothetical protein CEXT_316861, partial [Caerostris extrusa]
YPAGRVHKSWIEDITSPAMASMLQNQDFSFVLSRLNKLKVVEGIKNASPTLYL